MTINAEVIEVILANFFCYRSNIIVPNVSWGLGLQYECDMIVISNSGYVTEIEIKTTKSDIKRDLEKKHSHDGSFIKKLFFAVPQSLKDCELIPDRAGIISVDIENKKCSIVRAPRINTAAKPITEKMIKKILHLGCMRIWSLKTKLYTRNLKGN